MPSFIPALALAVVVAAGPASQHISESELARLASSGKFPVACGDATLAANGLRVKPSIDPDRLRGAAQAFRDCATGPYGLHSNRLALQSNFNAAAALLIAARHEAPASARADAAEARALTQSIIDFRQPAGARGPLRDPDPSPLITDAGRINRDATALLAGLNAAPAPS
jgi:hypothetical protein